MLKSGSEEDSSRESSSKNVGQLNLTNAKIFYCKVVILRLKNTPFSTVDDASIAQIKIGKDYFE